MNLSQLIQESQNRFDEKFSNLRGLRPFVGTDIFDDLKQYLTFELTNIVKESFKNTRVEEEKEEEKTGNTVWDSSSYGFVKGFNKALSDKHNKEKTFYEN